MRIPSHAFSHSLISQLQRLERQQVDAQNSLATGRRISSTSNDPTGATQAIESANTKVELARLRDNASQAQTVLNATDTTLTAFQAAAATAMGQADPTTRGGESPQAVADRVNEYLESMLHYANQQHDGDYLFGGTRTDSPPFEATRDANGDITAINFVGATDTREYPVGQGVTLSPFADNDTSAAILAAMGATIALRDGIAADDEILVEAAYGGLDTASGELDLGQVDVATKLYQIDIAQQRDTALFNQLETEISQRADADMTETTVSLLETQTAYQASLQSATSILGLSILNFI